MDYDYDLRFQKVALPSVRIKAKEAGGSGTVIYSQDGSTYVLTNHHVVAKNITIKDEWSTLLKANKKIDIFEQVDAHFFKYKWESRAIGGQDVASDIMAYDPDEDLALLKLRDDSDYQVAELYPRDTEGDLKPGMKVIAVGSGLGVPPVQTEGILSQFGMEIDRREYWLNSAASIFGNSGGALFLKESLQLVGVPSRIAVAMAGFSIDPITHLSWCVPITRIYKFLDDQYFRFIYDKEHTEESEAEVRKQKREDAERKLALRS